MNIVIILNSISQINQVKHAWENKIKDDDHVWIITITGKAQIE